MPTRTTPSPANPGPDRVGKSGVAAAKKRPAAAATPAPAGIAELPLGLTYALLLGIGLIVIAIWAIAYYLGSRQMATTVSTAVSGFATYAVVLLAVAAVARYLVGLFKWLYQTTKGWSRFIATDILVAVAVPIAIAVGWAVWR